MSKIQNKTICLVAIVKNEEKALPRMLESVKNLVDSYVIVDTGSTDNTIKLITTTMHKNGIEGEVHVREWENFGYNRTEAIQMAQGKADYLLLLDADMEVIVKDGVYLNSLDKDMYHIRYNGGLDYAQLLLVSGKFKWEYIGVTHEFIKCNDAKTMEDLGDKLTITHHNDGANRADKFERDVELLERGLKDEPDNARYMFYLANSYKDLGKYEKAIEWYQKRVGQGGFPEEIYYSLYQTGRMYDFLGKKANAKIAHLTAFDYRPGRLESLYEFIKLCREAQQYHLAHMALRIALQTPYPEKDVLFVHKSVYQFYLLFEFGLVSFYMGNKKAFNEANKTLLNMKDLPLNLRNQIGKNIELVNNQGAKDISCKVPDKDAINKDFKITIFDTTYFDYGDGMKSVASGFNRTGYKFNFVPDGKYEKADLSIMYGMFSPIYGDRLNYRKDLQEKANKLMIIERGFIKRDKYYSLGFNHHVGRGDYVNKNSSSDRFKKLGIKLKPWRKTGDTILLCGQVPWDTTVQHFDYDEWLINTVTELKKIISDDKKLVFRPHPLGKYARIDTIKEMVEVSEEGVSIEKDLSNAWCVVAYNSTVGIDALINGIPVITMDGQSMVYGITSHDLKDVNDPPKLPRKQTFFDIAYAQWTLDEISSGEAWNHLRKGLGI